MAKQQLTKKRKKSKAEITRARMTPLRKRAFIAGLNATPVVLMACIAASISRTTAYEWRNNDEAFAQDWDEALANSIDMLEVEAHRRGFEGTLEPVFHQGEECGQIRKFSDTLAIFLLKAHRPQRYREYKYHDPNLASAASLPQTPADEIPFDKIRQRVIEGEYKEIKE